jgi:hypothetical protein
MTKPKNPLLRILFVVLFLLCSPFFLSARADEHGESASKTSETLEELRKKYGSELKKYYIYQEIQFKDTQTSTWVNRTHPNVKPRDKEELWDLLIALGHDLGKGQHKVLVNCKYGKPDKSHFNPKDLTTALDKDSKLSKGVSKLHEWIDVHCRCYRISLDSSQLDKSLEISDKLLTRNTTGLNPLCEEPTISNPDK